MHKCTVSFNMAFRKVFGYTWYDSVRQLQFGFGVMSFYLLILKAKLMLTGSAEKSERTIIKR